MTLCSVADCPAEAEAGVYCKVHRYAMPVERFRYHDKSWKDLECSLCGRGFLQGEWVRPDGPPTHVVCPPKKERITKSVLKRSHKPLFEGGPS